VTSQKQILNSKTFLKFNLRQSDFKEWNCLSCPWLYVYNGNEYEKITEVLKDVIGKNSCTTDMIEIPETFVVNNKLEILLKEEKEEITFIDGVSLVINDQEIFPVSVDKEEISNYDENYLTLKQNESIILEFDLKDFDVTKDNVKLKVSGYYVPEESFVMRYLGEWK